MTAGSGDGGGPRTIQVDELARVEGEGSLFIKLEGDRATEVRLGIFEPPRFFEALLRGRSHLEAPDITSRICGICPAAYLLSACHAMEDALGIRVGGALRDLRRLLYFGEWIESHTLHAFLLHAPDFLGYPDALTMAKTHGDWVKKGLRIKRAGNDVMERLGGREIHPINVRVGGFYRAPARAELEALLPELRWGRAAAEEAAEWVCSFSYPALERDYEFVSLRHPDEYPLCEGRLVSSFGLDIDVQDYERHFVEQQVPHSNALHSRVVGRGACLSGPLARFNLCFDRLSPAVQALAVRLGVTPPIKNPFRALPVRLLEVVQAFEESIAIIERYQAPAAPFVDAPLRAAGTRPCAPRSVAAARRRRAGFSSTATSSTRRGRSSMPASCLPRRETSWPSRKTSTRWRRSSLPSPMKARHTARSRPSAITTRASPARRTF